MRKKIVYHTVAAVLITLSLTGCGSKNVDKETENVQTETAQTETIETIQTEAAESETVQSESASVKTAGTGEAGSVEDGRLQVELASLGDQVAFVDYDSNGTAMQVMLYKDTEGTVHGALNTCQVCAGSPYAYFEQEGNDVVCQNCGNHFSVTDIGAVHGGCNPVPLELSEDGEYVRIDTAVLDAQADAFQNWKKGI